MKRSRKTLRPLASTALPSRSNSMMSSLVTSAGASERDIRKWSGFLGSRALTWPKPSSTPRSARTRLPTAMSSIRAASTLGSDAAGRSWHLASPATSIAASATMKLSRAGHNDRLRSVIAVSPCDSRRAVAERRVVGQRSVPGEEDPGVLRDLRDVGVDQRTALRLGVDGGEMRIGQHLAHQLAGLAGVDEVVDDEQPLAGAAAELHRRVGNALEDLELALLVMVVARNADRIDHAHAQLACHDRSRHQTAAGDRNHRVKGANLVEPPRQSPAIPVELVPRNREGLARALLRAQFRCFTAHRLLLPIFVRRLRA